MTNHLVVSCCSLMAAVSLGLGAGLLSAGRGVVLLLFGGSAVLAFPCWAAACSDLAFACKATRKALTSSAFSRWPAGTGAPAQRKRRLISPTESLARSSWPLPSAGLTGGCTCGDAVTKVAVDGMDSTLRIGPPLRSVSCRVETRSDFSRCPAGTDPPALAIRFFSSLTESWSRSSSFPSELGAATGALTASPAPPAGTSALRWPLPLPLPLPLAVALPLLLRHSSSRSSSLALQLAFAVGRGLSFAFALAV
mmetsp:Transcript_87734/g.154768  ORF Transcript_87734/g.154768 Transcript_87734/m.154768 type:complete len:252 (+) Transcript_87734:1100-1855(+)